MVSTVIYMSIATKQWKCRYPFIITAHLHTVSTNTPSAVARYLLSVCLKYPSIKSILLSTLSFYLFSHLLNICLSACGGHLFSVSIDLLFVFLKCLKYIQYPYIYSIYRSMVSRFQRDSSIYNSLLCEASVC
jgi:hypothetical protein